MARELRVVSAPPPESVAVPVTVSFSSSVDYWQEWRAFAIRVVAKAASFRPVVAVCVIDDESMEQKPGILTETYEEMKRTMILALQYSVHY